MPDDTTARWPAAAVAGAAALVYLNTLPAEFVYDDFPFIVNNPAIHSLDRPWKFLLDRDAMSEGGFYTILRPLSSWIWSLAWAVFGDCPSAFHAINVLMHALASVCVWRFACATGLRRESGAVWAALVFALHPVQTEAVAWIAGLGNPLHVIGVTGTCTAYIRWRSDSAGQQQLAQAAGWAAFALLGKEHAVALPLLLVAIEVVLHDGVSRPRGQRAGVIAGAFVLIGGYVLWRNAVLGQTAQTGYWGGSLYTTALTMLNAFREYVRLLWWPANLHPEYVVPVALTWRAPGVVFSAIVIGAIVAGAGIMRRHAPIATLGIVWFFCALAPVSNVIPLKAIMNERLLYLAVIGFGLVLGTVLQTAHARRERMGARLLMALLAVQLLGFGIATIRRNQDWRTSERLWTAAVAAEPRGYTSRYNLGVVYAQNGHHEAALNELRLAIELRGAFPQAHGATGNIYVQQEDYAAAIAAYKNGLAEAPTNPMLRNNLIGALLAHGNSLAAAGRHASARGAFEDVVRLQPGHPEAQQALDDLAGASPS